VLMPAESAGLAGVGNQRTAGFRFNPRPIVLRAIPVARDVAAIPP
jgi:hypothetical protein